MLRKEITLVAGTSPVLCTSLLLSASDRRQSLHLAVHCKPDCPSHCLIPLSPCCNPKDMHKTTTTCLLSRTLTSVSASSPVLWALQSLWWSHGRHVWAWLAYGYGVTAFQSPQQDTAGTAAGEECNWFRPKAWSWKSKLFRTFYTSEVDFSCLQCFNKIAMIEFCFWLNLHFIM